MSMTIGMNGASYPERRLELLRIARDGGRLDVTAAAAALNVSQETVRRDLRALEEQGLVRRSYGVAYPVESGASRRL